MAVALSILSICLISFLYLRVQSTERKLTLLEKRLETSEQMREEMEQSLLIFAEEMKNGNDRILRQMSKEKSLKEMLTPIQTEEPIEKGLTSVEDYQPPVPKEEQAETVYQPSTQATIISLTKQGVSSTEIAKQLHMGKGEVDLIIKFQQKAN